MHAVSSSSPRGPSGKVPQCLHTAPSLCWDRTRLLGTTVYNLRATGGKRDHTALNMPL